MKSSEAVEFRVFLRGDWWNDNPPQYSIYLDDELIKAGTMTDKLTTFENYFKKEISFGQHVIKVRYENKTRDDTVFVDNRSVRTNFMMVPNIRLGLLACNPFFKTDGVFESDATGQKEAIDDSFKILKQGTFTFPFTSPYGYYFWRKL
jgi:hypothetical protein